MADNVPTSAGLSSFNLLDEKKLFEVLALKPGMVLLDFACGVGNYAIAASPHIGKTGVIHAVDPWQEGIETLEVRASIGRIDNIRPQVVEDGGPLPVAGYSVDLFLMATVVHILVNEDKFVQAMLEVQRVLKPQGSIAIVEFEKVEGPPGPPLSMRLAPQELAGLLSPYGFDCRQSVRVGQHNYLSLFRVQE